MDERQNRQQHAASFDTVADVYEASRPTYPRVAVDWLVPEGAHTVVDVGAGTGKFTRSLVPAAADALPAADEPRAAEAPARRVIAVDPAAHMLDRLREVLPQVDARLGSAESLPVDSGTADAVTFAQAWHWVDVEPASAEVARILRPGGTLGLIWNFRDERDPWVQRLGVAMHADGDQYTDALSEPQIAPPFASPESATFSWSQDYSRTGFFDLVRSRSYFALMDDTAQHRVLADVTQLLDEASNGDEDAPVSMPYVTVCFRYRRP